MALVSQSDIQARIGRSLTAEEASAFTAQNEALQALVEKMIGSALEGSSETSRFYDGGVQHLTVDPCTDITSVIQVDDDQGTVYTYDTTDYTKEPINRTLKRYLRHRPGAFQTGINNIKVTAKFSIEGDADTLAIVKEAMIDALASEVKNLDNIKKQSIEGYSVEFQTTESQSAIKKIKYLFPEV